jgi:hypothetical protein
MLEFARGPGYLEEYNILHTISTKEQGKFPTTL